MRMTLRALAALLGYPSAELQAHIPDIRQALAAENALPGAACRRLDPLLDSLASGDLLDLQADYSDLFDRSRSLSLNLFEHVHGDSRERGQAMINLGQQYIDRGFLLASAELPDFVPVFVEFASCLPPAEARAMLAQPVHVFVALQERLLRRGSAYAAVFAALVTVTGAKPDLDALAALEARAPSDDPAKIDADWEEEAVIFARPSHERGGPAASAAKIRTAGKAMTAGAKS